MFPEISPVEVDDEALADATDESVFVGLGVDFLIEAGSYLTIACAVYRDERGWNLEEAIVGGNGVRLNKLVQGFLDQTCQHRRELSEVLSRLIFETCVNIRYIISQAEGEIFQSYIDYSLKFERKLKSQIIERIEQRGGDALPIEKRMLESIVRLAKSTGSDLEGPPINKRNWGDKDLFQKAESVGWAEAYLGAFAGVSSAVHGNWGDIAAHHLERFDGTGFYKPCFDWSTPRPQVPLALARMLVVVTSDMLEYLGGSDVADHFAPNLEDLFRRIEQATEHHERFLVDRSE